MGFMVSKKYGLSYMLIFEYMWKGIQLDSVSPVDNRSSTK